MPKIYDMTKQINESSVRLHEMIGKAIQDLRISRKEYDNVLNIATEDGFIDKEEQALLGELQQKIEEKVIRLVD